MERRLRQGGADAHDRPPEPRGRGGELGDGPAGALPRGEGDDARARFDSALGIVLTAVAVSCEPEVVVLGGGIATSLAPHLPRYREELAASLRVAPELRLAELQDRSGAVGAMITALRGWWTAELGVPAGTLDAFPRVEAP